MSSNRIVITGAGLITGAGIGVKEHHQNLKAGGPIFKKLSDIINYLPFELGDIHESCHDVLVCAIPQTNQELAESLGVNEKKFDRHQLLALIAAEEAMQSFVKADVSRFACVGATGGAGLLDIYLSSKRLVEGKKLPPSANLKYLPNIFVGYLTQRYGLGGASHVHGTACAASMHALFDAMRLLQCGRADGALVVGTEAAISAFGLASFNGQGALGNGLTYHQDRTGFVMGEGAAAVVIEKEATALARGSKILAYINGYGETSDAVKDGQITDPSPAGSGRAMKEALAASSLPSIYPYINLVKTHGTATKVGDVSELKGLLSLGKTDDLYKVPVMSMKSYFGHLLGAAGVAEIISIISCMQEDIILPTRGLDEDSIDEECAVVDHVLELRKTKLDYVLCNGFGFGGTNASVFLSKK